MKTRNPTLAVCLSLALIMLVAGTAGAQYQYGSSYGSEEEGFIVTLEAMITNPRNTDSIVATEISGSSQFPVLPVWDDDIAGTLGVGYVWSNGNKLSASLWSYETDRDSVGNSTLGGVLAFAIGPVIQSGASLFGAQGNPGSYSLTTTVEASTADLIFSRSHEMSEQFAMEWSLGLRYANFKESYRGVYDESASLQGTNRFAVDKSNEGEMLGAKLGVRGTYRFGSFSVSSGLGFSMLDGEIDAFSVLTPNGSANSGLPAGQLIAFDDGRSGEIRDFDVVGAWRTADARLQLSVGWVQSEWEGIAADIVRNSANTVVPLRDRESVTFSGIKAGISYRF